MSGSSSKQTRKFKVNTRMMAVLAGVILLSGLGMLLATWGQQRRVSREAVAAARRLDKEGESELAIRHLSQHLGVWPADVDALELKARILARSVESYGQVLEAIKVHDQLIRLAPDAPFSQDARRRLVGLDVRYGEMIRAEAMSSFWHEAVAKASRFRAAEKIAAELIRRGGREPGDYLLHAMALDGMAVPGDKESQQGAVAEYRNVLALEPGNVPAAERLAILFNERLKDPERAEQVLDDLLKANPKSVPTRLARHRLLMKLHRMDKAAIELEEAAKLAPTEQELIDLLVASAELALRRGDAEGARAYLARVPEKARNDIQVLMVRGLIDFDEEQPDDAVDAWRRGLAVAGGTDAELTWWLAYALLQMNRLNEADPLIRQYQRFCEDGSPMLAFLVAMQAERFGLPLRSLALLDSIRSQLDPRFEGLIHLARGRCYEGLWDEHKAMEAYTQALNLDPAAVVPRLAIAKLKLRRRPDDAETEVQRGLKLDPENPALRIALTGARLRQQAIRLPSRRNWSDFQTAWREALAKAPNNSALALMWADHLNLSGRDAEGIAFLEEAAKNAPKSAAVAVALADGFIRLGKPERALETVNQAAAPSAAGDQMALRIARAKALTALYRGRDARAALTEDVAQLPIAEQIQIWMTAGQFDTARGDLGVARLDYIEALKLNLADPRPRMVLLDLAIRENDGPAIEQQVSDLLEIARRQASGISKEAKDVAARGDLPYMIARARQLVWLSDNPNLDAILGPEATRGSLSEAERAEKLAAARSERIGEASRLVDTILLATPEMPSAQMLRGEVLERQGDLDNAISAYMKLWERGTESALPRIVKLLGQRRRFDAINQLRQTSGSNVQVDLLSANLFARVGDRTQAGRIAEQLAQDLNGTSDAMGWQARMLDHLGRLDDAENALRAMAERDAKSADPWIKLIEFQARHRRTQAIAETAARAREHVVTDRPELLEARIAWASGDSAAAIKAFNDASARYAEDARVRVEAARFYEENGQFLEADAALRAALKLAPEDRRTVRQLATVVSARSAAASDVVLWREAWDLLGEPSPDSAPEPEDRFARAVVLLRAPQGVEVPGPAAPDVANISPRGRGIEQLEGLIADLPLGHPTASAARKYLAKTYVEADASGGATAARNAERVIAPAAAEGSDATAIALYAEALIQTKKIEAAEWQLDRLAAISPGDPREALLRTRLIWDRSRPVDAAAALEEAYTVREDDPGSEALGRSAFLMLLDAGNPRDPSAERIATRLARKNPSCAWMPALLYARRRLPDEAFTQLEIASQAGGRYDDVVWTGRAAMETVAGSDDPITLRKAEKILDGLLRDNPHIDELGIMQAMLRHTQGNYEDEVRIYKLLLERRPEHYVILNNLAWALSEGLQRYDEALAYADKLVEVVPGDPQALDTRGVVLTRLGKTSPKQVARAISDLEQVARIQPAPLHHLHLARAYELAGREEEAVKSREAAKALALSPKDIDPAERAEILAMLQR